VNKINIWFQRIIRSRTMIFSLALTALGAVQTSQDVFSAFMTPKMFGLFTVAIGIVVAILRVVTKQPLENK
jgi:hypothetical protein